MTKAPRGHTGSWSRHVTDVVEGSTADGWSLPAMPADGRGMPNADLDALAEAMLAGLQRKLAAVEPERREPF